MRALFHRFFPVIISTLVLAACATSPAPPPTSGAAPTPTLPAALEPTSAPTPTSVTLPATPQSQIGVLAENISGLDDLALAPDGSILVSNVEEGTIIAYAPGRTPEMIVSGLKEPEGIVALPDGSLLIAEQGKNRVVHYNPATQALALWLTLDNQTGHPGVDGIAFDAHDSQHPTVIVPDSPNGRVLRVSLDGTQVSEIARGLARPTGAAVESDGSVLIVDENGNALKRIRPDGSIQLIASLPVPDDVIVDAQGVIYVNTLGDSVIYRLAPASPRVQILIGGLSGPQGIVLDRTGDLIVTDTGHRRLIRVAR